MLDIERPAVALSRQSPRTSTIHFGIMETSTGAGPDRPLPMGWNTNLDSFLVWGETGEDDHTIHLTYETPYLHMSRVKPMIPLLRAQVEKISLYTGERLIDYVVVTDTEDWAEAQWVWLIDGTMSAEGGRV